MLSIFARKELRGFITLDLSYHARDVQASPMNEREMNKLV